MASMRLFHARPGTSSGARRADSDYGAHGDPDWRSIDWRPHLHAAVIAGRRVRYCDYGAGDGPPVVMIHGLGGSWQDWLENIPRIGKDRRVIALDLPGHGGGRKAGGENSVFGFCRCVGSFLEEVRVGGGVLVGHSDGGVYSGAGGGPISPPAT